MNHGTPSAYSNGCRCERCRQAWAEYQRRRRAASKSPVPVAEGPAPELPPDEDYDHGHEGGDEDHDEAPEGEACPTCQQVHELMSPEEEALFAQLQKAQEQLALVSKQRQYWMERAYAAEDKLKEAKPTTEGKANAEGKATTGYRPGRGNAKPTAPGKKVAEPVETKPPQPKEPEPQRRSGTLAAPFIGRLHTHELPGGQVVRHSHPDARAGHTHTTSAFNLRRQHG